VSAGGGGEEDKACLALPLRASLVGRVGDALPTTAL